MEKGSMWEILSMIGSLVLIVLVLVLTYYATRWYARRMGQSGTGKYIKVLDKAMLAAGTSVALVKVGERYYLLGAGDKQVNLLAELADFEELSPADSATAAPFSQVLRGLLQKSRTGGDSGEDGGDPL